MLKKVESGLIESYEITNAAIRPSSIFQDIFINLNPSLGIQIPKKQFISTVFPFEEFVAIFTLHYEEAEPSNTIVYFTDGTKKIGAKIEKDSETQDFRIKLVKTGSAFGIYREESENWVQVATYFETFNSTHLGFHSELDLYIQEIKLYKSPFARFFVQKENITFFVDSEEVLKNDSYYMYEVPLQTELDSKAIEVLEDGISIYDDSLNLAPGDVFYYTSTDVRIEGLDLVDFNYIDSNFVDIQIKNYGTETVSGLRLFSSFESALEVYFLDGINPEPQVSVELPDLEPDESVPITVLIKKVSYAPWHRYNFSLFLE